MLMSASDPTSPVNLNDACMSIVNSLLCHRQGGENLNFSRKAIESLVKKLKEKPDELDNLIMAVTTNGTQVPGCVTIPRTLDGRLQIAGRKCFPHVIYARIWRWPNLHKNELRQNKCCEFGYEMKMDYVCINPYHYDRVVASAVDISELSLTSSIEDLDDSASPSVMDTETPCEKLRYLPNYPNNSDENNLGPRARMTLQYGGGNSNGGSGNGSTTPTSSTIPISSPTNHLVSSIVSIVSPPITSNGNNDDNNNTNFMNTDLFKSTAKMAPISTDSTSVSLAQHYNSNALIGTNIYDGLYNGGMLPMSSQCNQINSSPSTSNTPLDTNGHSNHHLLHHHQQQHPSVLLGSSNSTVPTSQTSSLSASTLIDLDQKFKISHLTGAIAGLNTTNSVTAGNGNDGSHNSNSNNNSNQQRPQQTTSSSSNSTGTGGLGSNYSNATGGGGGGGNSWNQGFDRPPASTVPPLTALTHQKPPEYWCTIAYFELNQQVGEIFKVQSQFSIVTVDGYTDPSSPNRFCLGQLSNVHRSESSEKSRLYIGKGVELNNVGEGDVWIRCLSSHSVFVQSYYLDREAGRQPGDAVHKIYPGAYIKVFDIRQCHQQMRKASQEAQLAWVRQAAVVAGGSTAVAAVSGGRDGGGPSTSGSGGGGNAGHDSRSGSGGGGGVMSSMGAAGIGVDDLSPFCVLRLSFVKGWGPDYPRHSIKETPCWIEIKLNRPMQLLDEVLQSMSVNEYQPTRHFFANYYNQSAPNQSGANMSSSA